MAETPAKMIDHSNHAKGQAADPKAREHVEHVLAQERLSRRAAEFGKGSRRHSRVCSVLGCHGGSRASPPTLSEWDGRDISGKIRRQVLSLHGEHRHTEATTGLPPETALAVLRQDRADRPYSPRPRPALLWALAEAARH